MSKRSHFTTDNHLKMRLTNQIDGKHVLTNRKCRRSRATCKKSGKPGRLSFRQTFSVRNSRKFFFYLGKEPHLYFQSCGFLIDQNLLDGAVWRKKTTKSKWKFCANGRVILDKVDWPRRLSRCSALQF